MQGVFTVPQSIDNRIYYQGGSYGVLSRPKVKLKVYWHSCRETFHNFNTHKRTRFLFSAHEGNTERVISFIQRAEEILKLPQRTKFNATNIPGILLIRMSHFWKLRIRFQLFTILLRASRYYDGKSFYKSAKREPYLTETWKAFRRFMSGCTYVKTQGPLENYGGWYSFFMWCVGTREDLLKRYLVRPTCQLKMSESL